jgi:hypothetical protein
MQSTKNGRKWREEMYGKLVMRKKYQVIVGASKINGYSK